MTAAKLWQPQPSIGWASCAHLHDTQPFAFCDRQPQGWRVIEGTGSQKVSVPMCEEHGRV